MSEYPFKFKLEFGQSFRYRAFSDLNNLLPILKQKQREVVTDPSDINDINEGWSLILFIENKIPLSLPVVGSDTAALTWLQYPSGDDPLIQVGFKAFHEDNPVTENDVTGFPINGYAAFFGAELEPFMIHNSQLEIFTNQPLGEQIARLANKRILSDAECEAIVNMVVVNIDGVSDQISE